MLQDGSRTQFMFSIFSVKSAAFLAVSPVLVLIRFSLLQAKSSTCIIVGSEMIPSGQPV